MKKNIFYFTALGLILLDQISKLIFVYLFPDMIVLNRGIAFSIMFNLPVVILISVVVLIGVITLLRKNLLSYNLTWLLFIAGTIGNLIDRIRISAVIDFIDLGFFPVFNIADIYISLAAIGIIYLYILKPQTHE
jgi:signal peptidase II